MKKGLLLGKFMPVHNGHRHLIDTAMNYCDMLTIVVCTLPTEPIDGNLRYNWVKSLYPTCRVVHYDKVVPQEPSEHPNFWEIWTTLLKEIHPEKIDFVFTSEEYGDPLSKCLNANHICVDIDRKTMPVSGTEVRNNPFKYWDFIPDVVKPYYVKRVLITGPESTGKSTITEILASHFNTIFVEELARDMIDENEGKFEFKDLRSFMYAQSQGLKYSSFKANKLLFSDTYGLETKVFSEIYYNKYDICLEYFLKNLNKTFDLVLLMDIDIEWVDDGQRDLGHRREEVMKKFEEELDFYSIPYIKISGDYKERTLKAIAEVNKLLG